MKEITNLWKSYCEYCISFADERRGVDSMAPSFVGFMSWLCNEEDKKEWNERT